MIPIAELRELTGEARAVSAGLSCEQLLRRPEAGGWSVAECLEHVNTTNRLYVATTGKAIADGWARGLTGAGPFGLGLVDRIFVWAVGPPPRLKVKAPAAFQPAAVTDPDAVVSEWERLHSEILDLASKADGLDLKRVKISSPVNDAIRLSLLGAFHLIVAHDRRHLWQVRQISGSSGQAARARG